jgi:hypothetical protein
MAEYAPDAIRQLFDVIAASIPSAINSGIIGDQNHHGGYHRGRDYVAPGDYSAQYPADLAGDGQAASGLDISWSQAGPQFDVSQRLLDAVGDPRIAPLRSFFGSTDGVTVCGFDFAEGVPATSDDSHLWHIHLSIHRQWATDWAALAPLAEVITGGTVTPEPRRRMIEIFSHNGGIYCWTGSSMWLAPDIGYVWALQTSNLYAGDRGEVDQWFFDAARALTDTASEPSP